MRKKYKAGYLHSGEASFLRKWMNQHSLTITTVADLLQVSTRTVRRYLMATETDLPSKVKVKLNDFS